MSQPCGSRIVEVDNRVVVANAAESTLRFPVGNATKAWDDSGTARGVGSDPTLGEPPLFILDDAVDNVGIAMRPLAKGDVISYGGETLDVLTPVPARHKIALVDIDTGETVRKLGHAIGIATSRIAAGEHVHVHNLAVPPKTRAATVATTTVRDPWHSGVEVELTSFLGFRRRDGRVGTRNYIGILPSVTTMTAAKFGWVA
jgi:hypothetical protein